MLLWELRRRPTLHAQPISSENSNPMQYSLPSAKLVRAIVCACSLCIFAALGRAAEEAAAPQADRLPLWSDKAPIGDGTFEKSPAKATITVHRPAPDKATGTAVVICPGGGYGGLVDGPEGHGIAKWLVEHGIAGVVLNYRLPAGRSFVPLLDAQQAIRLTRSH